MFRNLNIIRLAALGLIFATSIGFIVFSALNDSPVLGEPSGPLFFESFFKFRIIAVVSVVILLLIVYAWTKSIIGNSWALLAVFLVGISPTTISEGHLFSLVTAEYVSLTLALIIFLYSLSRRKFWLNVSAGIFFGIAQVVSFQSFILVPYFILITLIFILRSSVEGYIRGSTILFLFKKGLGRLKSLFGILILGYITLYSIYSSLNLSFVNRYLQGIEATWHSWFDYELNFLGLFNSISSEPAPALILLAIALVSMLFSLLRVLGRKIRGKSESLLGLIDMYFDEIALIIFIILYLSTSNSILMIVPIIYITASLLLKHWFSVRAFNFTTDIEAKIKVLYRERFRIVSKFTLVLILVVWQLVLVSLMAPNFIGDDRGQDLHRLALWVSENNVSKIAVDYRGVINPDLVLGNVSEQWWSARGNPTNEDITWLAVSKSNLESTSFTPEDDYRWLDKNNFQAIIGNSIYVYKLKTI